MARVNIEESAFVMARRLGRYMGWDEDRALGRLARFWRDSQSEEIDTCTEDDIAIWFRSGSDEETHRLIHALIRAKTIEAGGSDYIIRGNKRHIDNMRERKRIGRENGIKGGRPKNNPDENQNETQRVSNEKPSANLNETHSATPEQNRTVQSRTEQEGEVEVRDPDGSPLPPKVTLVEIWNQHRGKLPEVRKPSSGRKRQAEARWTENPDRDYWEGIVTRIARSQFCNGVNDRGWKADFDFLVKPDTHARVIEGKYDNRGSSQAQDLMTLADLEVEHA